MTIRVMCLLALLMVYALSADAQIPRKAMEQHRVVPDVILKAPEKLIEVHLIYILVLILYATCPKF